MPLGKNLEDLLKAMDPAAAAAQRAFWDANPAIAEAVDKGTVPQAVFSRELNLKEERAKKAEADAAKVRQWDRDNRPIFDKAVSDVAVAEKKAADLQRQIDEAAAGGGDGEHGTVDVEKLATNVEKRLAGRMASEDAVKRIVAEEKQKLLDDVNKTIEGARKQFLEETFPAATNFQADLLDVMQDHRAETGKPLDRKALSDFMQANRILSPKEAYEKMMAPAREEKRIETEVTKRVNDAMGKKNMPGVTTDQSVPTDLGPLQLKISGETPKFKEGSELGDRSAAAMASAELRAEGNF